MPRRLLVLVSLVLLASIATARTRAVSHPGHRPDAATVSGVITSVTGNLVSIAGGLVTIDITDARVTGDLEPGRLLFAAVRPNADPNAPLQATMVAATPLADAGLFGAVDSIDTTARTLTVLGRTIHVTDDTSFGGVSGLQELVPNQLVHVQAEAVNGQLVATSVMVLAPVTPAVRTLHGTVRSITSEAWVIDETTVRIDARTRIAGSPKVGDTVDVLYRVDNANANIALVIAKLERPTIPQVTRISGRVRTMGASSWTITRDNGSDVQVGIERHTVIQPFINAGDRVEILARQHENGTYTALAIARR
ncbi:MAG TPA: DUF5666 domain-containing protein [Thermoanaerobaculia bacterium]|jgi:hypothetical protein